MLLLVSQWFVYLTARTSTFSIYSGNYNCSCNVLRVIFSVPQNRSYYFLIEVYFISAFRVSYLLYFNYSRNWSQIFYDYSITPKLFVISFLKDSDSYFRCSMIFPLILFSPSSSTIFKLSLSIYLLIFVSLCYIVVLCYLLWWYDSALLVSSLSKYFIFSPFFKFVLVSWSIS